MVDIMKKKYFPWCRGGRGRGLQDSPGQCRADKARQGGGLIGAAAPEDTGHNVRVDGHVMWVMGHGTRFGRKKILQCLKLLEMNVHLSPLTA